MDSFPLTLALIGAVSVAASLIPAIAHRPPLSIGVGFIAAGYGVFTLGYGVTPPDVHTHRYAIEHVTEVVVIIALMGVGLKLDRPLGWRSWLPTWRLLGITMPLSIAGVALVAHHLAGLPAATALLLGAALAPTDPVFATEVQVDAPSSEKANEDDVRLGLTSEAGLNDSLAFPFVYLAIALVDSGGFAEIGWNWFAEDVVVRVAVGIFVGAAFGRFVGKIVFRPGHDDDRIAKSTQGFLAVGMTFLTYGITEMLYGYGFLAVFVAALALRRAEHGHEYHGVLHEFVEQAEGIGSVAVLVLIGGAVAGGVLNPWGWDVLAVSLLLLLVVRPAAGLVALIGTKMRPLDRLAVAYFGVRGAGSIFYVAFALNEASFVGGEKVWRIVGVTIIASMVLHGLTATRVMRILDRRRRQPA